jgi:hypothetical protein
MEMRHGSKGLHAVEFIHALAGRALNYFSYIGHLTGPLRPLQRSNAMESTASTSAHGTLIRAYEQAAHFMKANKLPGKVEIGLEEDYRITYREVMIVVDSEGDLKTWDRVTRPFQLIKVQGIHDHGEAKPISDAVHYVVVRRDGADGIIGGSDSQAVQPIIEDWSLWVRFYPNGRTVYERPPTDRDLMPGRMNSFCFACRSGLRPMTGSYVPHQQLTQQSPTEIYEEFIEWMKTAFPNTNVGKSLVSDSSSVALHMNNPEEIKGRVLMPVPGFTEFGHLHEDGSMHVALSAEDRWEVIIKNWGEAHPAAQWGVNAVMVYAPRTHAELVIAKTVFTAAYKHAIGEVK